MDPRQLLFYVIFENPAGYPGKFVAKRDQIIFGKVVRDPDWIMVERDYEVIRKEMLRLGLTFMPRHMGDDPAIKETWI